MIATMRAVNQISRRSVLGLCGVGVLTLVGACTEDTGSTQDPDGGASGTGPTANPSDPPAPLPDVPDAALLTAALDRARVMVLRAEAVEDQDGIAGEALTAHTEQVRVLEGILEDAGIPLPPEPELPAETPGDDAGATTTQTPPAAPDDAASTSGGADGEAGDGVTRTESAKERREREEQERAARVETQLQALADEALQDVTPEALAEVSTASSANLALLTAIAGQRGGLAMRLRSGPDWPELAGPTGEAAAAVLEAFRPAIYGFEVLAARSSGDYRTKYERPLGPLRRLTRSLTELAGDAAPPAPLGYGLPDDLDTPQGRTALAEGLLGVMWPTIIGSAGEHTGDPDATAGTVRLIAEVAAFAWPWDVELPGFPGMDAPA